MIFVRSFILVASISICSVTWANKLCASVPWDRSISELVHVSKWIVVGKIKKAIRNNGQVKYTIDIDKVVKGDSVKVVDTEWLVESKEPSLVFRTEDCKASAKLEEGQQYIFFSETLNGSSIMRYDAKKLDELKRHL
jgi:hypothetical protein